MTEIDSQVIKVFAKHFATFMAFALLGWFVSWWNLSLIGVMFICGLYTWFVTFQKSKKQRTATTKLFFKNEKQAIQDLFEDIPRWVFFPDIERVEWLNQVVVKIWPDVTSYVKDFLKNNLEKKIQLSLPEKFKAFRFSGIDLGDMPPRVTGVKVYKHTGKDEIILDVDLFYAGDVSLSISISKIEAGIKDLQFKGTLRVVLKPLLGHPPFLGGIQMYFLRRPMLNFDLTSLASVFEIPGLYELLNRIIMSQVANHLILPNMLAFSFAQDVPVTELKYIEPKGVLMVEVLEAKNLSGHDLTSKSDPYVKLTVSAESFKTSIKKNCHNPLWTDEIFYFTVLECDAVDLELKVYDYDDASKDDAIGRVSLPLSSIVRLGKLDVWKELVGGEGSIHFRCRWYDLSEKLISIAMSLLEQSEGQIKGPRCCVSVFVDSAKDLQAIDKKRGEPSSQVKLQLDSQSRCTGSVLNTPNPYFGQNFHFLVADANLAQLNIKVVDVEGEDDVFGSVSVDLSKCLTAKEMTIHRPFVLTGRGGSSSLLARISLRNMVAAEEMVGTEALADVLTPEPPPPSDEVPDDAPSVATLIPEVLADTSNNNELRCRNLTGKESGTDKKATPVTETEQVKKKSVAGSIELSLGYNQHEKKVTVTVHRCRELLMKGESFDVAPDTYVKLQLHGDKSFKEKTDIYKDSHYPVFKETFDFHVEPSELHSSHIEITVKHYHSMFNKTELGNLSLPLSHITIGKPTTKWYPLNPVSHE